eukprot:238976-Prymnesium_polylepis.1
MEVGGRSRDTLTVMRSTHGKILEEAQHVAKKSDASTGGSRGLRGGSHSQFKSRLGRWVTFAALGIPKGGHFRTCCTWTKKKNRPDTHVGARSERSTFV